MWRWRGLAGWCRIRRRFLDRHRFRSGVGQQVVALFAIDQPGQFSLAVSGQSGTAGDYLLALTIAGDLILDGLVDGGR